MPTENNNDSLLSQLLANSANQPSNSPQSTAQSVVNTNPPTNNNPPPNKPKPPKKRITFAEFMRIAGAIVSVALIVFATTLAYIVFNPVQAQIFLTFGINAKSIAALLASLTNGIFGSLSFVLAVFWILFMLRAFLTKKEYRRKKTISTILAIFFGIFAFSSVTLWVFLIQKINASDYTNPDGWVVVYDNDKFISKTFQDASEMADFSNLIGPITLRFDLSSNAKAVSQQIAITGYSINFTGNDITPKTGTNPADDKNIVYTYNQKGTFKPTITYTGTDKIKNTPRDITVNLAPPITVSALVKEDIIPERLGWVKAGFDATDLQALGTVQWYLADNLNTPASTDYQFYPSQVFKTESSVCLAVVNAGNANPTGCNRVFIIKQPDDVTPLIQATIHMDRDALNPLKYHFSLGDDSQIQVKNGGIKAYKWLLNGTTVIGQDASEDYQFNDYNSFTVAVDLTDYAGKTTTITASGQVQRPIVLAIDPNNNASLLKITSQNNNTNMSVAYDSHLHNFTVDNVLTPDTLQFDARNIRTTDSTYSLASVDWNFTGSGSNASGGLFDASGTLVTQAINIPNRYQFQVRYTFVSSLKNDTQTITENMVINAQAQDFSADLQTKASGDQAPVSVAFNASASQTKNGKIAQFIFDFWDGPPVTTALSQTSHIYNIPGEYSVTLTVVRDDGQKATVSKKVIVSPPQNQLVINSSVASPLVGHAVDFDTNGSVWQITGYAWNFGDGNTSSDPSPTHTYTQDGTYTVQLTVTYADGTTKENTKSLVVLPNNG